jgi:hypothetical protein
MMEFRANKRWLKKRHRELLKEIRTTPPNESCDSSFFDHAEKHLKLHAIELALAIADNPAKWEKFKKSIRPSKTKPRQLTIKPVAAASPGKALFLNTMFGVHPQKSASRRRPKTTKKPGSRSR